MLETGDVPSMARDVWRLETGDVAAIYRGKIPKIPNTKSGTGFLTLPDSCFLYIAGDFVTK